MARKTSTESKPKRPRATRAPSELSIAVKSVNLLKRKQATRDKIVDKLTALDAEIVDLQNVAAKHFELVSSAIYGDQTAPPAGV